MPLAGWIVDLELLLPLSRSSPVISGSDYSVAVVSEGGGHLGEGWGHQRQPDQFPSSDQSE